MFRSIKIENFRGIRTSEIDDLSQVNLFFGKNNCGKSSVLEALFLVAGQSNPILPFNVNGFRGLTSFSEQDLAIDFYNLVEGKISIAVDDEVPRSLEITAFHSKNNDISLSDMGAPGSQIPTASYGLRLNYKLGDTSYSSHLLVSKKEDDNNGKITIDKRYKESLYAEYLPSSFMQIAVAEKFAQVVADKQEQQIVNILRAIEPKINDMQLVGNNLLVDVGLERRLPPNVMGDGVRKLVSVILSIYRCRNGILLVDEIDNGFHYSVMSQMWKAVFMSAAINNTQVFITTHNIESMKEMIAMLSSEDNTSYRNMLSAYKLIKDKSDQVTGIKYKYEQIEYSIGQEMEIR